MKDPLNNTDRIVCWPAQLARYMIRHADGSSEGFLPPVFNCPEADLVMTHTLSYAMNVVAGIVPQSEMDVSTPPRAQTRPLQTPCEIHDRHPKVRV